MARLIDLGGAPVNRSEAEVIQRMVSLLPSPWVLIPNVSVPDRTGHGFEYDAIAIGPHAVYVVEVKGWRGTIRHLNLRDWQLSHGRVERNPFPLADQKARVLKSLLMGADLAGHRPPYVQACLVCGSDDSIFEVPSPDLRRCLLPGQVVPYLLDASQLGGGGPIVDHRPIIPRLVNAITGNVEARKPEPPRYGSYVVQSLQTRNDESATWLGRHAVFPDGRVYRIRTWYLSAYRYNAAQREQQIAVLRRAAEALHQIGEHPNIATLRDFGEQADEFYEVTDWCDSGTLETSFSKGTLQRMPLRQRLSILCDIATGLDVAFRHGVVHRDLAPNSVILLPDGRARIMGFDRAFLRSASVTVYGAAPRRPNAYLPPELRDPKDYDVFDNSDVYSLARVAQHVLGADLPTAVQDLLGRAVRDEPSERPADPSTFLAELTALLEPKPAASSFYFRAGDTIDGVNRVCEEIGRGAGAVVYRVENEALGGTFALKLVTSPPPSYDAAAELRWLRAAASAHLPQAHWLGRLPNADGSPGPAYLLLEHVAGDSLRDHLAHGPVAPEQALAWVDDLLDALSALHPTHTSLGVLHRVVKPENVLIGPNGAMLVDFGTAAEAATADAAPLGTLRYTPPDLAGQEWTASADLFAVGCILYELCTGVHPWEGAPPGAGQQARPIRDLCSDLREPMVKLIEKAIAPEAASRFSTAAEMRAALASVSEALARPRTTAMAPPGEAFDQGARDIWNARRIQALATSADLLVPLSRALGECLLPVAENTPEAAEAALIGSEARALVLEAPLPDALPSLYDLLVRGTLPALFDASEDASPETQAREAGPGDRVLVLDGLHFTEWACLRDAASAAGRHIEGWVWAAGPVEPTQDATAGAPLDAALARVLRGAPTPAVIEAAVTTLRTLKTLAAAGARAFRVRLPSGDRTRTRLGPHLLERRGLVEDMLLMLLADAAPLWVAATFGSVYLGHGLRHDVGEGLGDDADEARARWAAAFPQGRVGPVRTGRLPSSLRIPVRDADGRRFPVGRLAWPDAPSTPWLQSGGLSLPERLLPLFRMIA